MTVEYAATRQDVGAGFSYTLRHALRMQLYVYGVALLIAALNLLSRLGRGQRKLNGVDFAVASAWAIGWILFLLIFVRLRTKKGTRTLTVEPQGI